MTVGLAAALQDRLDAAQLRGRVPSVVAGVVRDGALLWSGAAGLPLPDADTQYRIGSITKTFVAVTVLRLRDEGRLALTDRVAEHLPELADRLPAGATVAHLLSHTAGLPAETPAPWWERTPGVPFDVLAGRALGRRLGEPGSRFHYSNLGFAVAGELVARHRGRPWPDVVTVEVLAPLGMARTTPRPVAPHASGTAVHPTAPLHLAEPEHDAGAMAPAGQLWSTLDDLVRWAVFLSGGGPAGVLAPAAVAELRQPRALEDVAGAPWVSAYGLGVQVTNAGGLRTFGHGGSMPGFLAQLRIAEEPDGTPGDGAIVLANTTAGLEATLATDLLTLAAASRPASAASPRPADPDVAALAGRWYWGPAAYDLVVRGTDGLELLAAGAGHPRESRFVAAGPERWRGLDGYFAGEALTVVRRPDGTVDHLDLASFVFTREPYDQACAVPGGVAGWR
ncbi:MAG: beta-lactamase [Mycobacterium sp.]|nr:beta-lactamase [Mycobacterium sp.]